MEKLLGSNRLPQEHEVTQAAWAPAVATCLGGRTQNLNLQASGRPFP